MPRYRKNNKKKQKNTNKNVNNKKNNQTKEHEDKNDASKLMETVDLNLNSTNTTEENVLCVEIESNLKCNDNCQAESEYVNAEENNEDNKQVELIMEEEVSDSDEFTDNNQIIIKEINISELKDYDCGNVTNESNNDENSSTSNVAAVNQVINHRTMISESNSSDDIAGLNANAMISSDDQVQDSNVTEEISSLNSDTAKKQNQDYKIRRESKRAALENHFLPKFINPIYLDSIKEENNEVSDKDKKNSELNDVNTKIIYDSDIAFNSNNDEIICNKKKEILHKTKLDVLEEIEPYYSEIESVTDEIIEEVNNLLDENISYKSDDSFNLNTINENKIINDTNINENIISTTLNHPTQIEKLTTNIPSHTNPNENKYFEKYIYPEPPATNEKPQSNLEMNCEIVSQKILNISEEICADKSKQNSNKNNIQYNKIKDINNSLTKVENNENSDLNLNKVAIEFEKPCFIKMTSFAKNEAEDSNIKNEQQETSSSGEVILSNDEQLVTNVKNGLSSSMEHNKPSYTTNNISDFTKSEIKPLRLICTETLASMPYGEDILEELASVAKSLNHLTQQHQGTNFLQNQDNHSNDVLSEFPITNRNPPTNLGYSSNTLQSSVGSQLSADNKSPRIKNELLSSEYSSESSTTYILDKKPKISKEFQGCNDLLEQPLLDSKQIRENIVSSTNLMPNLDDTKSSFYDNNPKNNYKLLESVQQSTVGNYLNKLNTIENELNGKEKESSHISLNTNIKQMPSTKSNIIDNVKDCKNIERIVNIEITNKPFCGQLMQTASSNRDSKKDNVTEDILKQCSDQDILSSDDTKFTNNNNNNDKDFESSNNESSNLKEKFNKIMSDLKLETQYSEQMPKSPPRKEFNQVFINSNNNKNTNSNINTNINNNICYDEFRNRAKDKAIQRAKSEYFERDNFFKDFNRFSEIYNDDFFNKITDENHFKNGKIVNIPIKLEENQTFRQPTSETKLKTSNQQNNQTKENENLHKIVHIPIKLETLDSTENSLKKSEVLIGKRENAPTDNNKLNEFDMRIWSRNGKIRAPRLSTSTTNLPFTTDSNIFKDPYRSYLRKKQHASCDSLIDEKPITNFWTHKISMPSSLSTDWNDKHINYMQNDSQTDFNKLENDRSKLIEEMNRLHEKRRILNKELNSNYLNTRSEEEIFRQEMHNEWLSKIAEQEERRMQKTIKISKIITDTNSETSNRDSKKLDLTDEFLKRVEERRSKLCMPSDSDWESGAESHPVPSKNDADNNKEEVEAKIKVIDGQKEKDLKNLPKHLVEFAEFVKKFEEEHLKERRELKDDFWSVDQKTEDESSEKQPPTPPPLPLWSPKPSPTLERKEFRPVKFESPTLPRRYVQINSAPVAPPPWSYTDTKKEHKFESPITSSTEKLQTNSIKNDYMTVFESENDGSKNMAQLGRTKLAGVGPTTKDGIPISLRSEVDHNNQHQWYKTMFNTLHKVHDGDESVIIRYKSPRGRYLYKSKGYMSEPETNDSNYSTMKYTNKLVKRTTSTDGNTDDDQIYGTMPNLSKYGSRRHPGKIEDFTPGQSSVSEKKKSQQWEQLKLSPSYTEGNLSRVLKEQGYESESNVIIRKRGEPQSNPLSPVEQKQVYLNVQSGGEPPLNGFRKPAPEKPKEHKDFEYIPLASELTKHKHNKVCRQNETNQYSTHRTINTQNTVSFLPINKILLQPPTPPNRSSSRTRTSDSFKNCFNGRKSTPSSERHRRCFDTDFFTKSSDKFKTISLRKNKYIDTIFRSQSGGAVNKIDSKTDAFQFNGATKQYDRFGSVSPRIKATSRFTKRPQSLSPIAFGRSLSKERAFAVEKKRLEQSLPLCRKSFTASTNILRDPSLKSPNEVKKAVQNFAHIHSTDKNKETQKKHSPTYSKSMNCTQNFPCTRKKVNAVNNRKDKLMKFSYSLVSRGIDIQNLSPKINKTVNRKLSTGINTQSDNYKANSTISLTRSNSTFSINSTESKTKQTVENSNTYPKPKKLLKPKTKSTAGINSLIICPRRNGNSHSKKIISGMRKYHDLSVNCTEKTMNEQILNPPESIRPNNFFQNLFLRDVSPSLHSKESDSRMGSNFHQKSQFWSKFSTKSEPSLQRSNLDLSQKQGASSTNFVSCHIQTCRHEVQNLHPFHRENQTSDEEYDPKYFKKFEHRSLSEPRSKIYLSDHSSPNNAVQTISHSLERNCRPFSQTRGISALQKSSNLISPSLDGSSSTYVNKRFSPTREVRVPIKEIQSLSPVLNVRELQNQNKYFTPTLNSEMISEAIQPYSLTSPRKKLDKSFSPTREIRISQDSSHCYCPYLYNSNDNRSLSPASKTKGAIQQGKLSDEIQNKGKLNQFYKTPGILTKSYDKEFNRKPRSKSFSPTREIRICPNINITLPHTSLLTPTREATSPILNVTCDSKKKKIKEDSRTRTTEPDLRSPSHRRIQSFRENRKCEPKTLIRASSLSSADDRQKQNVADLSQPSQYNKENKRHSNKFLDLNNFYSNIERFGQLEHATSSTDLRVIRKQGQTVDYDEWKKIRAHKRAEKELNYVLRAIKQDEREKDFLFRPKELEDIKWTESSDCGLRCREKSVEDLRENFEKNVKHDIPNKTKILEAYSNKDIYKPHWRAMTVADLATNMQEKFNPEKKIVGTENLQQNDKSLGFSKKIISTLSKEQIHKIKNQLTEIYSSPLADESYKYSTKYEIPCQQINKIECNTSSKNDLLNTDLRKKKDDTISYHSLPQNIISKRSDRKLQNSKSCDRIPIKSVKSVEHELNETEKKKISKSLSQEIQTKGLELRKSRSNHAVPIHKESKRPINDQRQKLQQNMTIFPSSSEIVNTDDVSFRNIYSKKLSEPNSLETKDTEKENVNKKIKYFEEIKKEIPPKTIYHAREYSSPDEEEVLRTIDKNIKAKENQEQINILNYKQLSSSATDLKELFGEKESIRTRYLQCHPTEPSDTLINYISCLDSNNSFTHSDYNYGSTKSFENIYRSRSMSPIRERTYKKFWDNVNTGSVKKIKNKFENINSNLKGRNDDSNCLRKINSDPALNKEKKKENKTTIKAYENSDVSCIAYKFEPIKDPSRSRSRYRKNLSPIPRVQIKKADLMMPHIDIISKTASLKHELGKNQLTNSIYPKIHRSGNVDRIRCKFDHCSLLSQIYTSSPDISELKDISSYLRGEWIAHKFPNKVDNHKTFVLLDDQRNCQREKPMTHRRPSSTSPLPKKTIVTSILKPYYSSFGHQTFESLLQRPKSCYGINNNQDQQYSTGVTFEENDIAPPPPPKGVTFTDNGKNSESYYRCFEDIVNKLSPIRYECKDILQDEQLAVQQRESLAKIYQKEREKKHVQELKNMNNRRHADNFTPLQKLQIPLNRYDDFNADLPESKKLPKTLVKALYNFTGETERELSFKKGDVMYIKRLVDANWYEGEHNGQIGLLPANYIQIIPKNGTQIQQKKVTEGQGRAKFNFQAQSAFELSLNKGELVTLIRKVDENWFEGKIANRKGIFPVSYVEILTDIGAEDLNKPFRSPPVPSQNYQPSLDMLRTTLNHEFNTLTNGHPANEILKEAKTQILHVDTDSQPIAFRALYKYRPQNNDELELQESDIIYVLEICDDGWYVGTSQRTGCFGTFPGNYVERV